MVWSGEYPRFLIYWHELKLALLSASAYVFIRIWYWLYNDLFVALTGGVLAASLISRLYLGGNEPGKYAIAFYWVYFIDAYFLKSIIVTNGYKPIYSLPKEVELSMWLAFYSAIVASIARIRARRRGYTYVNTTSALFASILFTALLYLTPRQFAGILPQLLALSFALSLVAVRLGRMYFNLSVLGLLATALLLSYEGIVKSDPSFLAYLFLFSLAFYYASTKVLRGVGITMSTKALFAFPILAVVVWDIIRLFGFFPKAVYDPSATILPLTAAGFLIDTLKARRLSLPIVGGVGMADGLWFILMSAALYYFTLLKMGWLGIIEYILMVFAAYMYSILLTLFSER